MKKIFLIFLTFQLALPCLSFAQNPSQNDEAEFGIINQEHFYWHKVNVGASFDPEDNGAIDNIPIDWVTVNRNGLFHTANMPETTQKTESTPWDSLYHATHDYLTFYFDVPVYKRADTTRVSDIVDDSYDWVGNINGTFINGVKEGIWEKQVYSSEDHTTKKVITESYKNGVLNGARTVYDTKGTQLSQTIFVNGTGNYNDYYYDSGRLAVSGFMVYGKRHGWWIYYNKNGEKIREEFYRHGLLHGPLTVYNRGNVIYETNFVNGTGEYRTYENDVVTEHGRMENGLRVGEWGHLSTGFTPKGFHRGEVVFIYKEQDPVNNPANVVDVMFYNGEYVTVRAHADEE
jgi:hypothetical protein